MKERKEFSLGAKKQKKRSETKDGQRCRRGNRKMTNVNGTAGCLRMPADLQDLRVLGGLIPTTPTTEP